MDLQGLISNPLTGAVALWIFSGVVHTMPSPTESSGAGYLWLYNFMQFCGSNWANILGKKVPPVGGR